MWMAALAMWWAGLQSLLELEFLSFLGLMRTIYVR
jgi:hypothetical protein